MRLRTSSNTETNKQVHSYSAPALCSPDTSEARVGEQAVMLKSCTRSEHALLHRCLRNIFSALCSSQHKHANMPTCKNMPQTCQRFMPMFVQAKQLNVQGKRNEGTLKETEFPPDERAFVPCRAFPEQSSTGLGRVKLKTTLPARALAGVPWTAPEGEAHLECARRLGRCSPSRETKASLSWS